MTKLLTEQELQDALSAYTNKVIKAVNEGFSLAIADADGFLKLIQSQKKAHADMVIGTAEMPLFDNEAGYCTVCDFQPTDGSGDCLCLYRENLRVEQRERNK